MNNIELLKKYNKPVPRYTSYPTVPYWSETPTQDEWIASLNRHLGADTAWSMYIHVPFCETLCSYCGCNTIITKDHSKLDPYLGMIYQELDLYKNRVSTLTKAPLRSLHFGGGSPSFIKSELMATFLDQLYSQFNIANDFTGSIELDPRRVKKELIETLAKFKINRISFGVQDFNLKVQECLNRVQPYELTEQVVKWSRDLGLNAINFDLIYGLPKQDMDAMKYTIECTLKLRPERIALYSLAMVPWEKKQQRLIKEEDLPTVEEKRALYDYSRIELLKSGYIDIGMDHFALPDDELNVARENGSLHRNFMGYTEQRTDILLGLGVSSISETPDCFHQNQKILPQYEEFLAHKNLPTMRGHKLSDNDIIQKEKILKFMTQLEIKLTPEEIKEAQIKLESFLSDNLITMNGDLLQLTEQGGPFLRNVATFFDQYLTQKPEKETFSKSI